VSRDQGPASAAELEGALAAFTAARGLFESLVGDLADRATDRLTHGELEAMIGERGREVMRELLQGHMDLRSIREPQLKQIADADGVVHRRVEPGHQRLLATVFGTVTVTRIAYRALGAGNLHPLDAALNLPVERASHGLRRLSALEAVRGSFDDAKAAILRATGTRIGKRQIEQLTVRAAVDVERFYRAADPLPCTGDTPLIISVDGKGIVMRPEALRQGTARSAEAKGGNKMRTRLSGGEKLGRKRMAMLGTVYDAQAAPRTGDDVIAPAHEPDRPRTEGPKAFNKWLTGSVTDNTAEVVSAVFDQAEQRDPRHHRPWVILVDGAAPQIEQILAEANVRGVTVHIVCDFIHVLEYLWKAAWCFHTEAGAQIEAWIARHARAILAGDSARVAADLTLAAKNASLSDEKTEAIEKVCTYLRNKHPYLRYDQALSRGWPIATGIIEGACRHLVKDRLDITGARWSLPGAEAVLKLRALISNGDFDTYFTWHLRQEHHRTHQTRYHDKLSLAA
jgi:hypothetical protein